MENVSKMNNEQNNEAMPESNQPENNSTEVNKGLKIPRYFTREGVTPFEMFNYVKKTSLIKNPDGSLVFQMEDVEVPDFWSQTAIDVLAQKYFRKAGVPLKNEQGELLKDESGKVITGSETSIKQVAHRIAGCWRYWGEKYGYFNSAQDAQNFYDEMAFMIVNQNGAPNSPQWFNTGLNFAYGIKGPAQGHSYVDPLFEELKFSEDAYSRCVPHACFIQSVNDDLVRDGGIFSLLTREARIFKYGSGTGSNFSNLRGKGESLSGGGTSSGMMSFLKIFDVAAGSIKSGGTTRRAAKMVCLDLDHPEIRDFIWWKVREEEKVADLVAGSQILKKRLLKVLQLAKGKENPINDAKVQNALREALNDHIPLNYLVRTLDLAKQDHDFPLQEFNTHYESEAYITVSGQNSNNSIRIPNTFFESLESGKDWELKSRTDGSVMQTIPAQQLWDEVGYCAWASADPGVQFDTTINEWHTCPENGRINGSNPCVTGDTKVLTAQGKWIRIDSIVDNPTKIITNTNLIRECSIDGSFVTGKKPVYKLTTKSGYELKLTADHQVFTINRGFVAACELTKDDYVQIPAHEVAEIKEVDDATFYQMLGVYLGDGCGGEVNNNRGIQITMSKDSELPVLKHFSDYVASSYSRITHQNSPATVQLTKTSGKYVITNNTLIEKFQSMVDLKLKSHEKQLSETLFALPLGAQKYLLQGLFTADGTVAHYTDKASYYVSLDSSSLQLLKDVQLMLLGFGIKSKLYKNRRAGKDTALLPDGKGNLKEYSVREMHSLRISRSSRVRFGELIGFMPQSLKQQKLQLINDSTKAYEDKPFDAVDGLVYMGEETVYDLTEPQTHTFVANGITIHNCSEYMFLDDTACNLASLNLAKFYHDNTGVFDVNGYRHAVRLWAIALEISVLMAHFPSEKIALNTHEFRTLGLGFANLGTLLMLQSIPYDSEKGRAIAGALAAILTGEAYATSAEMAQYLGAFKHYEKNKKHMLRVIRNHRRAAYAQQDHEELMVKPLPINQQLCPPELLQAAHHSWDKALSLGEKYGYRNAQTTVMAPTGTIAFVMDCDTTGVEPDYALVKYKKLAGGGFFKIVNQSVPKALKRLGYNEKEIQNIIDYCLGKGSFSASPEINRVSLIEKGLSEQQIEAIEKELPNSMDINFMFNQWTLGGEFYNQIMDNGSENFLINIGYSQEQIDAANRHICGTMTLEGAPHLKQEHYAVFDCANRCGKLGKRYIHPYGHLKMMAGIQSFVSGAISKTVNMPSHWDIEQIKKAYYDAWTMMIKGVALYRDGCKLSQPLNTTLEEHPEMKKILQEEPIENVVEKRIPIGNKELHLQAKLNLDSSTPEQLGWKMDGLTPAQSSMLTALVNNINVSLQNGLPSSMIAKQSLSVAGHPVISELQTFLLELDSNNKEQTTLNTQNTDMIKTESTTDNTTDSIEAKIVLAGDLQSKILISDEQMKCAGCGATQLRPSGTCMVCEICGDTTGCG